MPRASVLAATNEIAGGERDGRAGYRRSVVGLHRDFDVNVAVAIVVSVLVIGRSDTGAKE